MKNLILLLLFITLTGISCIPSLYPLYNDATIVTDDRLLGTWVNNSDSIAFNDISIKKGETEVTIHNISFESDDASVSIETWNFDQVADIHYLKKSNGKEDHRVVKTKTPSTQLDSALLSKGYQIEKIEKKPYYFLQYSTFENGEESLENMIVHLTKINSQLYLDFFPQEQDMDDLGRFSSNFIPGHTFAKVSFNKGQLQINSFDSDYITELIENKRIRLKHEWVNDMVVLTASTEELRAFVEKYGQNKELYLEAESLTSI